jgi:3-deoxy-7-phosphoheptulonate synthase
MSLGSEGLRITGVRPLIAPAMLLEEIPTTGRATAVVADTRRTVADVLNGRDPRLVVIVGPCSIHDPAAALDYAGRLKRLAERYANELVIILRCYFEKPRTGIGWKGLINDPDLDGSFHVNKGLRLARKLLLDVNELGLPTGSEFLDTHIPQYFDDLTSWAAIGARTTESQVHRELASGLSMPVGFKNSTDGNVLTAIDAVEVAASEHWFPGLTKHGVSALFHTTGNNTCHVILRGGSQSGPNYHAERVQEVCARLASRHRQPTLMVDCSHGNSLKDFRRQPAVAAAVCEQVAAGSWHVFGAMVESHLSEGRQDHVPGHPLRYGQSITDGCLSIDATEPLLEAFARAQQRRGPRRAEIANASRAATSAPGPGPV